jgi:hypothetical protein
MAMSTPAGPQHLNIDDTSPPQCAKGITDEYVLDYPFAERRIVKMSSRVHTSESADSSLSYGSRRHRHGSSNGRTMRFGIDDPDGHLRTRTPEHRTWVNTRNGSSATRPGQVVNRRR